MTRLTLLLITLFVSLSVAAFHIAGEEYYFYWTYWWYDIVAHGLGGLAVGLLLASAYHAKGNIFTHPIIFIVLGTIGIGIAWEIFEYAIKSQQYEVFDPYVLDTVMDLGMDTAGGLCAYLCSKTLYE